MVVLIGTAALIGFAKVGADVFTHKSTGLDATVQAWMLSHQDPLVDSVFLCITMIGGITGMRVLAIVGAVYLWFRGHRRVAAGVLVVPVVSVLLFNIVKDIYERPRPAGLAGHVDHSFSFPSGHATTSAAVCCTLAYVLWREGFVGRWFALAFAVLVPLLVGVSRLYLNVHWATDVLGGWSVGLFIAALSAALYNHHRRRRRRARDGAVTGQIGVVLVVALGVTVSPAAHAQSAEQPSAVVITGRDLGIAAGATVGTAALSRLDVPVALFFGDSAFHARHPGFTTAAKRASIVTETVLMITGGTIYGIARLRHDDGTADVAFHGAEAVLFPAMFIQVIRGTLGRARPYVVGDGVERPDSDPYHFAPLRGFTSFDYRSFPSMHAMASVAVAAALSTEMRERNTPHRAVISPLLYAGAALPGLARIYLDQHWASDIALGAFLGAFAGQKVVGYSHAHPTNRLDRAFLGRRTYVGFTSDARGLSLRVWSF